MGTATPTEGISCPHGALLPAALGPRAKRTAVPPPLWDYFKDSWEHAQKQRQQPDQPAAAATQAAVAMDPAQ